MLGHTLGFIGAGQMARAIGFPLIQKGLVKASDVIASSPEKQHLAPWKNIGCATSFNNGDVINCSDIILWAVKPQIFQDAVKDTQLTKKLERKLHVSIMAGVSLERFTQSLVSHFKKEDFSGPIGTARVMPNIAMKVSAGCAVYTVGHTASETEKLRLIKLLSSMGLCIEVPESQINAYCGLFASGIGFMFPILEAMSDGAVKMGIPRDLALKMSCQTMKGAAELMLKDEIHPAVLKDLVCSPGGTTIAGVAELEKFGIRNAIIKAIEAATKRGEELGKNELK